MDDIDETNNNNSDQQYDTNPPIWIELECEWKSLDIPMILAECNQCPCQFADITADLTNNDQVKAILWDKQKMVQYNFSKPFVVDYVSTLWFE